MIPFEVLLKPGKTVYEQVVFAATRAIIFGQMRAGDPFPSVRTLSRELKINPNTAHKVIHELVNSGLLEIRPGVGSVVTENPESSRRERERLLEEQAEELVVEAKRLRVDLQEVLKAVNEHWKGLKPGRERG